MSTPEILALIERHIAAHKEGIAQMQFLMRINTIRSDEGEEFYWFFAQPAYILYLKKLEKGLIKWETYCHFVTENKDKISRLDSIFLEVLKEPVFEIKQQVDLIIK